MMVGARTGTQLFLLVGLTPPLGGQGREGRDGVAEDKINDPAATDMFSTTPTMTQHRGFGYSVLLELVS